MNWWFQTALFGKTEQQRERELYNTQCGVVLAVTNGDAVGTGGDGVYAVVACGGNANQF